MKKFALLSNLNLHLAAPETVDRFLGELSSYDSSVEGFLIAGNLADYSSVIYFLKLIRSAVVKPIVLVFGDTDLAYASIDRMTSLVSNFCNTQFNMYCLYNTAAIISDVNIFGCCVFPTVPSNAKYSTILELSADMRSDMKCTYCFENCLVRLDQHLKSASKKTLVLSYFSPFKNDREFCSSELGSYFNSCKYSLHNVKFLCCGNNDIKNEKIEVYATCGKKVRIIEV